MSDNTHAVRWARRKVRNEYEWTRWHWTEDTNLTLCDVPIALANEGGTFLPDTDDDIGIVDCKHCLRILHRRSTSARLPAKDKS